MTPVCCSDCPWFSPQQDVDVNLSVDILKRIILYQSLVFRNAENTKCGLKPTFTVGHHCCCYPILIHVSILHWLGSCEECLHAKKGCVYHA